MTKRLTTGEFIERACAVHGDFYTYVRTDYHRRNKQVIITCQKHGDFWQLPFNHLMGKGCPECKKETLRQLKNMGRKDFIDQARQVHGNKYHYDRVKYINARTHVSIVCPSHGEFRQIPHSHLKGRGCQRCNLSNGEREIARVLESLGIPFETQKEFPECKDKRPLRFDFYFVYRDKKFLVEFQGIQHSRVVKIFEMNGKEKHSWFKRHDRIKRIFARDYGYTLLEIPYTVKDIHAHLTQLLQAQCPWFDTTAQE